MRTALLILLLTPALALAQSNDVQPAYTQARDFEARGQLTSALDSFRSALKHSDGACTACLEGIYRVQLAMEDFRAAADTATRLAGTLSGPAAADAHRLAGQALFRAYFAALNGEGAARKDPRKAAEDLQAAEAALAAAVTADPASESARFLHARVLAALHRDADASREFTACAATPGASAAECARAARLAQSPDSARLEPAPAFQAETLDGHKVSLDSLAGKVVLVDFWATWCKFCLRDSDYVQSMLDSFDAKDFALVEVNVDDSAETWRSFVKQNRLAGLQVHDNGSALQSAFHVKGFPTYLVLDANGTVRFRISGAQGDLRAQIRNLLTPTSSPSTPPPAKPTE